MFSKNEMEAYHKISAPNELKEKIVNGTFKQANIKSATVIKIAASLAACFVLVFSINFFMKRNTLDVVVNGNELKDSVVFYDVSPVADMRMSPMYSVPVEITAKEANITVSSGNMTVEGEEPTEKLEVSGNSIIWWNIERSEEMPLCEMEIEQNGKITLIILEFDNAGNTITARKVTK